MFIVQKNVKEARRLVGKGVVRRLTAKKRAAKRRNRRRQKTLLRVMGEAFEPRPILWSNREII